MIWTASCKSKLEVCGREYVFEDARYIAAEGRDTRERETSCVLGGGEAWGLPCHLSTITLLQLFPEA